MEDLEQLHDSGFFSDARLAEIVEGAQLKVRELQQWREVVVARAFAPEVAMYWEIGAVGRGRRSVYVGYTLTQPAPGCARTELVPEFVAAYETVTEVLNALKQRGFVSLKDYESRAAGVFGS